VINDLWPSLDPGSLRHSVTLLQQVSVMGTSGMQAKYQAGDAPIRCRVAIEYIRGDEMIKEGQDVSRSYLKITGWYRQEFVAGLRIQTGFGKQYIIQYAENVRQMNIVMVLTCIAIGANE